MLCQQCQKRAANVHFTQVLNSNKVDFYLCEQCARETGQIQVGMPLNINDFFNGIMGFVTENPYINAMPIQQVVCENCGMSYDEFQKTGRLGCGACYEMYSERLKPLIKRLHGNLEHTGKLPSKISKNINTSKEIETLKTLLLQAIQKEEYEKAAELRDRIKSMEAIEG